MRRILLIISFGIHCLVSAQCPNENLIFTSQSEVDAFAASYPNCTELNVSVIIDSNSEEDPILNIDALSNLSYLKGISFENFGYPDAETDEIHFANISGLSNLDSLHSLYAPNTGFIHNYIESFAPISGLSGWMTKLDLSNTFINSELPEFSGLDSIAILRFSQCDGFTKTPEFPNLTALVSYWVTGTYLETDSLRTFHIPNNLVDISYPDSELDAFIFLGHSSTIVNITGAENLEILGDIEVYNNQYLTDLSIFDQITTINGFLRLTSCRKELFNSFPNLEFANSLSLDFNFTIDETPPCLVQEDIVLFRQGENSDALLLENGIGLSSKQADQIIFTGNLKEAESLYLNVQDASFVSGFEELEILTSEDWSMLVQNPGFPYLPSFQSLERMNGQLKVRLGYGSILENLIGLDSLKYLGDLYIYGTNGDNQSFQSLEGLNNVDTILNRVHLNSIPNIQDISALSELEFTKSIDLNNLPNLNLSPSFSSCEVDSLLSVKGTGLSFLPELPLLNSLYSLRVEENPSLQNTDGLSQLNSISGDLTINDNAALSSINFASGVDLGGNFTLTANTLLENCANSPTICSLISTAESSILSDNGSGCISASEILDACMLSSVENDDFELSIFPNPVVNEFSINGMKSGTIAIYDLNGRLVFTSIQPDRIDISELESGIYILSYTDGKIYGETKLIKL